MPVNDQILSTDHDYIGAEFKPLCSTRVAVTGGSSSHGRASGQARSADGTLSLELRMPDELGGDNLGPNPEQLFAAGYAACRPGGTCSTRPRFRWRPPWPSAGIPPTAGTSCAPTSS